MLACGFAADISATNEFGQNAICLVLHAISKPHISALEIDSYEQIFDFLKPMMGEEEIDTKLAEHIRLGNQRACTLLQSSCNVDIDKAIDSDGNTFLIRFTKQGLFDYVKMLLKLGANPQKTNLQGEKCP